MRLAAHILTCGICGDHRPGAHAGAVPVKYSTYKQRSHTVSTWKKSTAITVTFPDRAETTL